MKRQIGPALIAIFIYMFFSTFNAAPGRAQGEGLPNDMSWLDGFTLVVLETETVGGLHAARLAIQSHGGRVAIMSPPSLILGWIPYEIRSELIGKAGIKEIYYTEVLAGEVETPDVQTRLMVDYFNAVARGDIQKQYFDQAGGAGVGHEEESRPPDAFEPPPIDEAAYLENLRAVGLDPAQLKNQGLLVQKTPEGVLGNSDRMTGTISVTLFFVESNGASDPNLYTWTSQAMQNYVNGTNTGLAWWTAQSYNYFDCWNAFFVRYFPGTDPRCQQPYEPVLHDSGFSGTWISLVMSNFGYTSGDQFAKVNAYNSFQRSTYGTNWAFSGFIAYNPPPAADRFTNGVAAFAYLGGPYTVLLFRSFGWNVDQVFTHESGHIFWACDEYSGSGCSCTNCVGKQNQNCYLCSGNPCMMKSNSFLLCAWTPAQIGWTGSGCAPPPLPPPVASSASPGGFIQGTGGQVTVIGSNFLLGATAGFGPGVTVNSATLVGSETLLVDVSVDNAAAPGFRNVVVTNRDLQTSTLPNAFEVKRSTRHYVSPTGADVFPYLTPANAATALSSAINAAGMGDTVFVASMTFNNLSMTLDRGVLLYGGWNSTFTVRDLENGKTVLNLSGNVTILPGVTSAGLDGFILQNGTGSLDFFPLTGYYGGGVRILNATGAVVANCEIRSNRASQGGNYGAGGGIFALSSSVDIRDNYIWGNTATHGGAVYLHESGGNLSGNTISGNTVSPSTIQPLRSAQGGGIMLVKSAGVQMANNTITSNTGAYDGGGVYAENSSGIALDGDMISYNRSSFGGAGIHLKKSTATCRGVDFFRNTGQGFGAGIASTDSSSITVEECSFLWNNAVLAGAIYAGLGQAWAWVRHNLFVGNSDTNSAGAVYLSGLSDGSLAGNTLDRNASSGGTGGAIVASSPIEVYNNIVVNSTGVGLSCSGTPPTLLAYNLAWNNSGGNYSGCSPGTGSLSADPLFADTAGVDYHLALHSPAIDSGRPGALYEDPDGSRGDLGWYGSHSFVMDQPSRPQNLAAAIVSGDVLLSWNRNPEADVASYAVYKDTSAAFVPAVSNFAGLASSPDTTFNAGPYAAGTYYKISAVDASGYAGGYSDPATVTATGIGGIRTVFAFRLYQNVPNPFNPVTRIQYELSERGPVVLDVYDVGGRRVERLFEGIQGPGVFSVQWDGRTAEGIHASSGIYFYRLRAGRLVETRKMVLLK